MPLNKIAIIVGAGAVQNAWIPVLKALKIATGYDLDADGANCLLARYIYMQRFFSKIPHPDSKNQLKVWIRDASIIKRAICGELKLAQKMGVIKPQKEFRKIIERFVTPGAKTRFGIISTNWDTVIDDDINSLLRQLYNDESKMLKCFHIHGSVEYSEHLYLPSETTQENYRTDEENKKFGFNHFETMQLLQEATQIIIYGLSLDPLDAELSQFLGGSFVANTELKEIIIINPDYERVRSRVKLLLLTDNIKISCFLPENLNEEI